MLQVTVHGCAAASPTPERSLPAISVMVDGDVLLLDCGEGTQRQMMRHGVSYSKIHSILISHLHLDHFLGVFGLQETLRLSGRSAPLRLFGPIGSRGVFGTGKLLGISELTPTPKPSRLFELNGCVVSSFEVKHTPNHPAFGFAIEQLPYLRFHESKAKKAGIKGVMFRDLSEKGVLKAGRKTVRLEDVTYTQPGKKIVYSGDTIPCPSLASAAKNADLLIHDCTFSEELADEAAEKFHSTARGAAKLAKSAKAKSLLLTHISSRYADPSVLAEEAKKEFKGKVLAAYDGMKIEV